MKAIKLFKKIKNRNKTILKRMEKKQLEQRLNIM